MRTRWLLGAACLFAVGLTGCNAAGPPEPDFIEPLPAPLRLAAQSSSGESCGSGSCTRPFLVVGSEDETQAEVLDRLREHLASAKDWEFCDASAARLPRGRNGALESYSAWSSSFEPDDIESDRVPLAAQDVPLAKRNGVVVLISTSGGGFVNCANPE